MRVPVQLRSCAPLSVLCWGVSGSDSHAAGLFPPSQRCCYSLSDSEGAGGGAGWIAGLLGRACTWGAPNNKGGGHTKGKGWALVNRYHT